MSKNSLNITFRNRYRLFAGILVIILGQTVGIVSSQAAPTHVPNCRISHPGVSTEVVSGVYQIRINSYVPKANFCFLVPSSPNGNYSSEDSAVTSIQNLDHAVAINYTQPSLLPLTAMDTPLATIVSSSGLRSIQIYGLPTNFPKISTIGDSTTISKMNFLTTPVYQGSYYAIAIQAGQVAFWSQAKFTVQTLRQLNDAHKRYIPGTYAYAYLDASGPIESYAIGTWHFLDSNFREIGQLNSFKLGTTTLYPEGHGVTLSRVSNPVVFSYVARVVDGSWLSNPLSNSTILDCQVSEVHNGIAIHSFSFWDWANSHKSQWKDLINNSAYPGFTPIVPVSGAADLAADAFHCNSIEYIPSKNAYAISLRGVSSAVLLSGDLTTISNLTTFPGAGEHYVRSYDGSNFTALGNFPNDNNSKLISWNIDSLSSQINYVDLPFLSAYCGNLNVLNDEDIWWGGGCGTRVNRKTTLTIPSDVTVLGEYIKDYKTNPRITGALVIDTPDSYSYRTDLYSPIPVRIS